MNMGELLKKADTLKKESPEGAREAARIYASLLESDPVNTDLLSKAIGAFYVGTDWEETDEGELIDMIMSRRLLKRAVALQPGNAAIHRVFGDFWDLWSEGSKEYHEKAAREYKRALELDPQDSWSAIHLASGHMQLDPPINQATEYNRFGITSDQAIEYLERARSDRPDQDWLLIELSRLYYWKKDYGRALEMALLARSKLPEELDMQHERLKKRIANSIERLKRLIEK